MKIKKFNENQENQENQEDYNKFYIFQVHSSDTTYRGSIWDTHRKPWIPNRAKLLSDFKLDDGYSYMVVSQKELDEINKIKEENKIKKQQKKFNI